MNCCFIHFFGEPIPEIFMEKWKIIYGFAYLHGENRKTGICSQREVWSHSIAAIATTKQFNGRFHGPNNGFVWGKIETGFPIDFRMVRSWGFPLPKISLKRTHPLLQTTRPNQRCSRASYVFGGEAAGGHTSGRHLAWN